MPVDATTSTTAAQSGSKAVSNPNAALDKDGFLKLFIAQLQHQDPTSPMSTNDSMNQMASFSMVEQITNMADSNAKIVSVMNTASAVSLIGREITYTNADKLPVTGTVDRVTTSADGFISLTVAGVSGISPSKITDVA